MNRAHMYVWHKCGTKKNIAKRMEKYLNERLYGGIVYYQRNILPIKIYEFSKCLLSTAKVSSSLVQQKRVTKNYRYERNEGMVQLETSVACCRIQYF